jgi:PAS domain S-box-containing protein
MSVVSLSVSALARVLLLEDADADARAVESLLRQFSFDVSRSRRLSDALTALRSDEFDVVLADLGLPDSTGLDTLEALRQHAVGLPIVVMTGHDDESTAVRAVAAGAQDYLIKGSTDAGTLARSLRYAVERGRAQAAIGAISEAHLRNILEGALDAVVSMNHDGRIIQWNRSAEEIFGWQRAEALGRPLVDLIVPERFREAHLRGVQAFMENGEASFLGKRAEWTGLRKDGSEFPAEVRITAEADAGGMTFTAFVSDITERRRAEEERNASEARLRALVEHASDLIYLANPDGTLRYVSPAVKRMLDYAPEELLGRRLLDFVHPDDVEYVTRRFVAPTAQGPIPVLAEFRFRHKDGSWRHLEVLRVNRLSDPAVSAIVGNVRDVTARRQAQQALDGLRRRYELILNSITDGVHGVDLAGNIVFENPAAAAMLGWPPGALIGRSAHQTVQPLRVDGSARPEAECPLDWTLADGGVRSSDDDVFWRRDGKEIRVAFTTAPMLDEQGRIAGAVVTFRDVSKQKQMEQQIEQAARVESLGRVSASVAHEFNNLLMGIRPFADMLNRKAAEDPALAKPVRQMLNVVRRGQRLTDEILRFTNPGEPRMLRLDLAALLRDFGDEARGILGDRRMEMELPEALVVRADVDQISQVMLNLVTNARDATKPDDVVTIGAARASSMAFLHEQLPAPERYAALYVRDTGCGIDAEAKARLFEPFFTTRKRGGTGLGLAIAWRIAAAHGGRILVDSEAGRGAAFYLVLPVG